MRLKIRENFPGNKQFIKIKTDHLSKELIIEELSNAKVEYIGIVRQFGEAKKDILDVFGKEEGEEEILRHRKHFMKVLKICNIKIEKKLRRDSHKNTKDEKVETEDLGVPSLQIEINETRNDESGYEESKKEKSDKN